MNKSLCFPNASLFLNNSDTLKHLIQFLEPKDALSLTTINQGFYWIINEALSHIYGSTIDFVHKTITNKITELGIKNFSTEYLNHCSAQFRRAFPNMSIKELANYNNESIESLKAQLSILNFKTIKSINNELKKNRNLNYTINFSKETIKNYKYPQLIKKNINLSEKARNNELQKMAMGFIPFDGDEAIFILKLINDLKINDRLSEIAKIFANLNKLYETIKAINLIDTKSEESGDCVKDVAKIFAKAGKFDETIIFINLLDKNKVQWKWSIIEIAEIFSHPGNFNKTVQIVNLLSGQNWPGKTSKLLEIAKKFAYSKKIDETIYFLNLMNDVPYKRSYILKFAHMFFSLGKTEEAIRLLNLLDDNWQPKINYIIERINEHADAGEIDEIIKNLNLIKDNLKFKNEFIKVILYKFANAGKYNETMKLFNLIKDTLEYKNELIQDIIYIFF